LKKPIFIAAVFLLLLGPHQTSSAEFRNGLGAGLQYGGIVGWQSSLNSEYNKFRLSIGYAGITFGYDRYLGSKFSLGGQAFLNQLVIGAGLNLNYYFNSNNNSGWLLGLDAYRGYVSAEAGVELVANYFEYIFDTNESGIDAELNNRVALSIGYQF